MRRRPLTPPTIHIDVGNVSCDECGASPGEPCRTRGKAIKKFHQARHDEQVKLIGLCTGSDSNARWWRWRISKVGAPRPLLPHGTHAAYMRHRNDGTEPCKPCERAYDKFKNEQNAKRRAARAQARAVKATQ